EFLSWLGVGGDLAVGADPGDFAIGDREGGVGGFAEAVAGHGGEVGAADEEIGGHYVLVYPDCAFLTSGFAVGTNARGDCYPYQGGRIDLPKKWVWIVSGSAVLGAWAWILWNREPDMTPHVLPESMEGRWVRVSDFADSEANQITHLIYSA